MTQLPVSQRAVDGGHIKGAQPVPLCYEIVMRQTLPNAKVATMKAHAKYVTPATNMQTAVNSLYTAISAAWLSNLAPLMHSTTRFNSVSLRDMASVTNPVFLSTGAAVPGSGVGNALPSQDCVTLTAHINQRGKGLSGRSYWSGWIVDADAGNGLIDVAVQAAMDQFGQALFTALQNIPATPAVAQVERAAYISLTGATIQHRPANTALVLSYTCKDLFWDTQRRRDIG